MMILRITPRFWLLCLLLILLLALVPRFSNAQGIGLESRMSQLESEIFQLRSRLSNLESQISRANPPSRQPSQRPDIPSPSPRRQTIPPSDEMFDRLATLVIELKERVQTLEKKVAKLEAKHETGNSETKKR
ncbi:MAG: hypothetical protein ABEI32_10695 [Halothece sp.]